MSTEPKLYVISIPGPDDMHAAPSLCAAELMKAAHDKSMAEWLASQHDKGQMLYLSSDSVAAIIEECDDAELHAELLTEFKYADWGITEADLVEIEGASQAQLFAQEGGAA
jgi:hypothetical protein